MAARLARARRVVSDRAPEWLHLAIITGPFIWLPAVAFWMMFAERLGWMTEDAAYDVVCWATGICIVLWLPASPLVRFFIVAIIEATRDAIQGVRWVARRFRQVQ